MGGEGKGGESIRRRVWDVFFFFPVCIISSHHEIFYYYSEINGRQFVAGWAAPSSCPWVFFFVFLPPWGVRVRSYVSTTHQIRTYLSYMSYFIRT